MRKSFTRLNFLALIAVFVICGNVCDLNVCLADNKLLIDTLHILPVPRGIEGDYRGMLFITENAQAGGERVTDSMPIVMVIRLGVNACVQGGSYGYIYDTTVNEAALPEVFCSIPQGVWFTRDGKIFLSPGETDPGSVCDPSLAPNSFIEPPGGGETIELGFGPTKLKLPPFDDEIGDSLVLRQIRIDEDRETVFRLELLSFTKSCCCDPGDGNGDGKYNIADITFIIARIFTEGPAPECQDQADANGDNTVNIADVTYGIARLFTGGSEPICGTTGT